MKFQGITTFPPTYVDLIKVEGYPSMSEGETVDAPIYVYISKEALHALLKLPAITDGYSPGALIAGLLTAYHHEQEELHLATRDLYHSLIPESLSFTSELSPDESTEEDKRYSWHAVSELSEEREFRVHSRKARGHDNLAILLPNEIHMLFYQLLNLFNRETDEAELDARLEVLADPAKAYSTRTHILQTVFDEAEAKANADDKSVNLAGS